MGGPFYPDGKADVKLHIPKVDLELFDPNGNKVPDDKELDPGGVAAIPGALLKCLFSRPVTC